MTAKDGGDEKSAKLPLWSRLRSKSNKSSKASDGALTTTGDDGRSRSKSARSDKKKDRKGSLSNPAQLPRHFGVPIKELMRSAGPQPSTGDTHMPGILVYLCEHMRDACSEACKTRDPAQFMEIARGTVDRSLFAETRREFDIGNFHNCLSEACMFKLLKTFLRELPASLLPEEHYSESILVCERTIQKRLTLLFDEPLFANACRERAKLIQEAKTDENGETTIDGLSFHTILTHSWSISDLQLTKAQQQFAEQLDGIVMSVTTHPRFTLPHLEEFFFGLQRHTRQLIEYLCVNIVEWNNWFLQCFKRYQNNKPASHNKWLDEYTPFSFLNAVSSGLSPHILRAFVLEKTTLSYWRKQRLHNAFFKLLITFFKRKHNKLTVDERAESDLSESAFVSSTISTFVHSPRAAMQAPVREARESRALSLISRDFPHVVSSERPGGGRGDGVTSMRGTAVVVGASDAVDYFATNAVVSHPIKGVIPNHPALRYHKQTHQPLRSTAQHAHPQPQPQQEPSQTDSPRIVRSRKLSAHQGSTQRCREDEGETVDAQPAPSQGHAHQQQLPPTTNTTNTTANILAAEKDNGSSSSNNNSGDGAVGTVGAVHLSYSVNASGVRCVTASEHLDFSYSDANEIEIVPTRLPAPLIEVAWDLEPVVVLVDDLDKDSESAPQQKEAALAATTSAKEQTRRKKAVKEHLLPPIEQFLGIELLAECPLLRDRLNASFSIYDDAATPSMFSIRPLPTVSMAELARGSELTKHSEAFAAFQRALSSVASAPSSHARHAVPAEDGHGQVGDAEAPCELIHCSPAQGLVGHIFRQGEAGTHDTTRHNLLLAPTYTEAINYDFVLAFPRTLDSGAREGRLVRSMQSPAERFLCFEQSISKFPYFADEDVSLLNHRLPEQIAMLEGGSHPLCDECQRELQGQKTLPFSRKRMMCRYCCRILCSECCKAPFIVPSFILHKASFEEQALCSSCHDHLFNSYKKPLIRLDAACPALVKHYKKRRFMAIYQERIELQQLLYFHILPRCPSRDTLVSMLPREILGFVVQFSGHDGPRVSLSDLISLTDDAILRNLSRMKKVLSSHVTGCVFCRGVAGTRGSTQVCCARDLCRVYRREGDHTYQLVNSEAQRGDVGSAERTLREDAPAMKNRVTVVKGIDSLKHRPEQAEQAESATEETAHAPEAMLTGTLSPFTPMQHPFDPPAVRYTTAPSSAQSPVRVMSDFVAGLQRGHDQDSWLDMSGLSMLSTGSVDGYGEEGDRERQVTQPQQGDMDAHVAGARSMSGRSLGVEVCDWRNFLDRQLAVLNTTSSFRLPPVPRGVLDGVLDLQQASCPRPPLHPFHGDDSNAHAEVEGAVIDIHNDTLRLCGRCLRYGHRGCFGSDASQECLLCAHRAEEATSGSMVVEDPYLFDLAIHSHFA